MNDMSKFSKKKLKAFKNKLVVESLGDQDRLFYELYLRKVCCLERVESCLKKFFKNLEEK